MPMFQRRHYEVVAKILRRSYEAGDKATMAMVAAEFASLFERDNGNFQTKRFYDAAIPDYVGPKPTFGLDEIEQALREISHGVPGRGKTEIVR